jgi:Flp pilus assembly protein TadD
LQALDRALELDRKDSMTLTNKGTVLINLGRYEEALAPLEDAISIDPNNTLAWRRKSSALVNLGREEEAR